MWLKGTPIGTLDGKCLHVPEMQAMCRSGTNSFVEAAAKFSAVEKRMR